MNGVIRRIRCSLFDLAPGGVCLARPVTRPAGELLPHRFTLTSREIREAVYSLLHFPWPRGRWVLPITVSFGARTFLPPGAHNGPIWRPPRPPASGHPVHSSDPTEPYSQPLAKGRGTACIPMTYPRGVLRLRVIVRPFHGKSD